MDSNEQVAPERLFLDTREDSQATVVGGDWSTVREMDTDTEYIRLDLHIAALAKQGSPPASLPPHDDSHEIDYDRYCLTCSQMGYCGMCGKPEQDVPPPADTVERAKQIIGNVEFYLTEGGDLSTEAFANLSRRISAALLEKDAEIERLKQVPLAGQEYLNQTVKQIQAEVWDKVTGEIERQRDKRKAQFGGLIECSQRAERLNGALDALTDLKATLQVIRKQTAARTSEKGTHEPTS